MPLCRFRSRPSPAHRRDSVGEQPPDVAGTVPAVVHHLFACDDDVGDVGRGRRVEHATGTRAGRAGAVEPHGHEVGHVTARDHAAVVPAERAVAVQSGHAEQVGAGEAAALQALEPLVHLDAAHLLEGVDDGVLVGTQGEAHPGVEEPAGRADAVGEVALGRRAAVEALAGEVLARLLRQVHVQRPVVAARDLAHQSEIVARHGTHRVHGRADPHGLVVGQPGHPLGPRLGRSVGEPLLHLVQGDVAAREEPAGEVAGVEQRDPDADLARRADQRLTHDVRVVVAPTAGRVVHVVELAHGRVPGEQHLGEDRLGERVVGLRVEAVGHGIHRVAPRPEVAAVIVGATAQCAVEHVAVAVGEAWQDHAGEPGVAGLGRLLVAHVDDPATVGDDPHRAPYTTGEHRVLAPERGHAPAPARSVTTSARAAMPSKQSSAEAHSSGECDTPVGLRTKSMALRMPSLARMPASWPAPVPITGRPSSRVAMRRTSAGSKSVVGVQDSWVSRPSKSETTSRTSETTRSTASASEPRASSHPVARLAMSFTPPGWTCTLPTVATQPCVSAARRAAMIRAARPSMASSRSASAVVPAWLASPGTSTRQRPCGQMSLPTPTEWPRSTRCRPCSTCSSTNAPIRASVSSSRPRMAGSRPARRIASAIVTPSLSVSPRARSAPRAPVMTRDPAQATPNLAPSSSAKFTIPTGRDGAKPSCRSWSTAARAPTTPSGPSKAPPSGTESRCEPMTTPGSPAATAASGSPHQAHWLPIRSVVRSSPRSAHSPANHSRRSWSSRVQANRWYPPVSPSTPRASRSCHIRRNPEAAPPWSGVVDMGPFDRADRAEWVARTR